jgi:predicted nucleotidyltransferase
MGTCGVDLGHGIDVPDELISSFCAAHHVRRLALFGSVLGDRFDQDSDLDVLIEFEPDSTPGLLGIAAMELELEALVGRRVDLRTYGDLSRYFRDRVAAEARPIYAA